MTMQTNVFETTSVLLAVPASETTGIRALYLAAVADVFRRLSSLPSIQRHS